MAGPTVTYPASGDRPERPDPAAEMLRWFDFLHLPEPLAVVSARFGQLADWIVTELPPGPEKTTAMRKLLEAKDCAVRAELARGDL